MRKLSYEAHFTKNGTVVFRSVMFTGIIGVYTGIREDSYSISENTRKPDDGNLVMLAHNIAMIYLGYKEISWVIRETLT